MGTNFYLNGYVLESGEYVEGEEHDEDNPAVHIGKRSAAGPYCWDCNQTLIVGGESQIHKWHTDVSPCCPSCGATPANCDAFKEGAVAVELGFSEPNRVRPTGVRTCSSFTWAQQKDALIGFMQAHVDDKVVVDEYGRALTGREFVSMLESNCPVEFHFVGEWFS